MTASASTQDVQDQQTIASEEAPKLWAGKYKTAEEMEVALLRANKETFKIIEEKNQLAEKVKEIPVVPESYAVPAGLEYVTSELSDLKLVAKQSGLSQTMFEKMVTELNTKRSIEHNDFEEKKVSLGTAKMAVLKDYVEKNYPAELQDTILTSLIKDEKARGAAMSDREKRLNSSTPGFNTANPGADGKGGVPYTPYEGFQETLELARQAEQDPGNLRLREKLINTAAEVGRARFGDKT